MVHYNGKENVLDAIKTTYTEKFGAADLEKASLKVISNKDGFLTLRCNLDYCKHILETFTSMDKFLTLNMSGTLRALRSRTEGIKKRMSGNSY